MLDFNMDEIKHRLAIKHELRRLGVPYDKNAETWELEELLNTH